MKFLCLYLLFFSISHGQEEKKGNLIDFDSIKNILQNDMLEEEVKKQQVKKKKKVIAKKKKVTDLYNFPPEGDFWSFFTEYWLVKNAQKLKWDFSKPDYGLQLSVKELFEKLGYYEIKFKVLILDSPLITHFALPSDDSEYIFLLSLPFIRTLNLSKLEIGLILLEDFFRVRRKYMTDFVSTNELKKLFGGNFEKSGLKMEVFDNIHKKYDEFIFKKGFSFQQQYEVTIQMGEVLKSDLKMWNFYYGLIRKIDNLTKTNTLYANYTKMYPSPEIQMNWLTPKKEL